MTNPIIFRKNPLEIRATSCIFKTNPCLFETNPVIFKKNLGICRTNPFLIIHLIIWPLLEKVGMTCTSQATQQTNNQTTNQQPKYRSYPDSFNHFLDLKELGNLKFGNTWWIFKDDIKEILVDKIVVTF